MKRSQVNDAIIFAKRILSQHHFLLPAFAEFTPDDWQHMSPTDTSNILSAGLGWDVTDFGFGQFTELGLTLFTIRNHSSNNNKPYAEKIMVCQPGQVTPMHYHWNKMEDIINRGGGDLVIELYKCDKTTDLLDKHSNVEVEIDGVMRTVAPGEPVILKPGQSICLTPYLYHSFYPQAGAAYVLAGEVSMANDDDGDNRFLNPSDRYSNIEEDEQPIHLLCSDYSTHLTQGAH